MAIARLFLLVLLLVCLSLVSFSQQAVAYSYANEKVAGYKTRVLRSNEETVHRRRGPFFQSGPRKILFAVNGESYHWLFNKKKRSLYKGDSLLAITTRTSVNINGNDYQIERSEYSKCVYLFQGQPIVKETLLKKKNEVSVEINFSGVPAEDVEILRTIVAYEALSIVWQKYQRRGVVISVTATSAVVIGGALLFLANDHLEPVE